MAEVEKKHGWLYGLIGGCGGCLILVVILAIIGFVLLMKTGLVGPEENFDAPTPVREVSTDSTFDEIQSALVRSALTSLTSGEVSIVLSDEMLTVLMRDGLAQAGEDAFDVERAQIAVVEEGYLELFVPLMVNDRETTFMANIGLELVDQRVRASVDDVRIGNLRVPGSFATAASEEAIQRALDSQLSEVQGALELTDLTLTDGELRLSGAVDLNPLQLFR